MDEKLKKTAPESAAATQEVARRPHHTFRIDDCSLSLWARERMVQGEPVVFYSATLERSDKEASGEYKYTKSFDADSLGKVVSLCQQASEYLEKL